MMIKIGIADTLNDHEARARIVAVTEIVTIGEVVHRRKMKRRERKKNKIQWVRFLNIIYFGHC